MFAHGETKIGAIADAGVDDTSSDLRWTAIVTGDCDVGAAPWDPGVLSVFLVREPTRAADALKARLTRFLRRRFVWNDLRPPVSTPDGRRACRRRTAIFLFSRCLVV
jgi:hypothetical protein